MISYDFIKDLAVKYQTTELNIRREYIQHLFLSYLYQKKEAGDIYFKGGTALRIVYNSPRFSEDLDFSSSLRSLNTIEKLIVDTLSDIEREGITTDIQESKSTSGAYLSIISFALTEQKVSIQLEISLRNQKKNGELTTIVSDFVPTYTIVQFRRFQLVAEKLQALFSRKKPRDFYDLYFLLRSRILSAEEKEDLPNVLHLLQKVDIQFERELKEFLPKNQWPIIKDLPNAITREIQRYI